MTPTRLMTGAEPFFYPGGDIGCVVTHGFTGAPQEVRWLGRYLADQGCTVIGPRLAGHGTQPGDMRGISWHEWYADILAAYQALRRQCRAVFVIGLSMGGSLSLNLAANEDVTGVVGLAAPYFIYHTWRRPILKAGALLGMSIHKAVTSERDRLEQLVRAEQSARGEPVTGHIHYPQYPNGAIDQLWSLLAENRSALRRVTAPALLIQSVQDDVVPLSQVDDIYETLGSADKRKLILTESHHVITEDVEREIVFKAVGEFISQQAVSG